jgi:geranylgeranyl reductase family protein
MIEAKRSVNRASATIHADVGIIGAGPAGLATALHLAQLGVKRVVIVDRCMFPRDKTCGSAISPKGLLVLDELGLGEAVAAHSYAISGMRLVTPGGHDVMLSGRQDTAIVCHRRVLDHIMLQKAEQAGAGFLGNFDVTHLLQRSDRVVGFVGADGREIRAKYTVVADGAHTRFACERGPRRLVQAIMGWWEGVPFEHRHIEMIFDRELSPYYGWLFPEAADRVNIGICYEDGRLERNARSMLQAFLDKHYGARLSGARQIGTWKGHQISYDARIGSLTSPGRVVVGEAGRMTHPATAEGIYQGIYSGMLAARALRDILNQGAAPERALSAYERQCRRAFAASFRGAAIWKGFVQRRGLDTTVGIFNRPYSRAILARTMAQM